MAFKYFIAKFLRIKPINIIYCLSLKTLSSLGLKWNAPLIVNKKVKIFFNGNKYFNMHAKGFDTIAARVYLNGFQDFEIESISHFIDLVKDKSTFFDIGANTGYYSLLAKSVNSNISVHGFEPVPEIHENFQLNCALNEYEKSIQCQKIALSDFNGSINFDLPISINYATGGSTNPNHRAHTRSFECKTMTLDKYCTQHGVEKIDIMKIDTESTEPSVLRGGENILTQSRPIMIIEILNPNVGNEILNILKPLNYKFSALTEQGLISCDSDNWDWTQHNSNYLFTPKDT